MRCRVVASRQRINLWVLISRRDGARDPSAATTAPVAVPPSVDRSEPADSKHLGAGRREQDLGRLRMALRPGVIASPVPFSPVRYGIVGRIRPESDMAGYQ